MDVFNILTSAVLAVLSFSTLVAIGHRDQIGNHLKATLIFWGATFFLVLVLSLLKKYSYELVFVEKAWIATSLDSLANMSLIICAYSLFKGNSFQWNDRILYGLYAATPALFIVMLVLGILIEKENVVWKLFYITPSALIASFTLIFLAIGAFKEQLFNSLKWPILVVFVTYAYIQIPGYVLYFVPTVPEYKAAMQEGIKAITLFATVGKLVLIVLFLGLLVNASGVCNSKRFLAASNITVGVFSIGFALLVLFYRIATAMEYAY
ncbi:MAG: hypothetical protein OQL19_17920 [Gammaproteobacteria bacterium]|nr:hypothetical protein [Gammaproteobacteria bacterium]